MRLGHFIVATAKLILSEKVLDAMRIWLVTVGEPLPTDGANLRLHRVGTLARYCAARGHEVTWWTSTLDHMAKRQRAPHDQRVTTGTGIKIEMLHAPGYQSNVSVQRLVNHYVLGHKLSTRMQSCSPPDIIHASWPTMELCSASVKYAKAHGVPVVLDVRDLWPDIFVDILWPWLRPAARLALLPAFGYTRHIFRNCTGIIGISQGYLNWGLAYAGRSLGPWDRMFPLGYERTEFCDSDARGVREELINAGVDPGRTVCWFVGMFGALYDLGTVISAASMLQEQGDDRFQFVFSGGGDRESRWRQQASGLKNVVFTGWVDSKKICCLGTMAHIGLAAYTRSAPQGLPNKFFEYMAWGLPIVSSLSGEGQIALEEHRCGLTYDASDPESLLSCLETLQGDEGLRKEFGENAQRTYHSLYAANKVYNAMVDYLELIVSETGPIRNVTGAASSLRR